MHKNKKKNMTPTTRSTRSSKSSLLLSNRVTSTRQRYHRWTDEELNFLAYGRARGWSYARIQRTNFPSYTTKSLNEAYLRISIEERARRASIVADSLVISRNASQIEKPIRSDPIREPRHFSRPLSQPEVNLEAPRSSSVRQERDNGFLKSTNRAADRYNLRPKEPRNYRIAKPRCLVNRFYFPHFVKTFKNHLESYGVLDKDYIAPSHSPTPDPSDLSPSDVSSLPSAASSLDLFGLEARPISPSERAHSITSSQSNGFGLNTFYNAIPTLDNASDWFQWNQKVNEFIRISAVADDGSIPPVEEEEAQQWTHPQRIKAFDISQVQPLIKAIKNNFKPEGTGTYVNLQRQYMSLTREKCGSAQALGAEIRKIHAEKLLLDPECVTSEIERTFFFMHALGPEYESFRDHMFRQIDLVNERDENGTVTKAAPSFDYIENKAIEEEHRKAQLGKQPTEARALPALAVVRGPGEKKVIPSSDGNTCRIEIDNVPYCSFCRKPYHRDSECFSKNPRLKDQKRDGKKPRLKPGSSSAGAPKSLKRQPTTDDEDDDVSGPKDSKKPTFMTMRATEEDVNAAFEKDIERNLAEFSHTLAMMTTKTLSIHDAWIVDSGCAQHVCNNRSKFVQLNNYCEPPLRSVDASTAPLGVGTVNILCSVRDRRK
ncbi:hypothetical protein AJ78_08417 [Emergomyces pasteurianus Ep9510]|uniref:Retrovirus-related Pol polyprotein from transposon TNT 1-94-like beta-barrel domain-containing protein n=1 Tax=Emergomyces pasteurianus Ep9510 TaxID=1447872 RepID=A0A1J9P385_9EURO|nr:hypothetical protein AJ78_08417 [Emergomyces pasteurianus Ep9510]